MCNIEKSVGHFIIWLYNFVDIEWTILFLDFETAEQNFQLYL
jgi:hypothetical protein